MSASDKSKTTQQEKLSARSSQIEEQIKNQQKRKEEKAFLEELGKRISIAREGKMLMEKGNYPKSLENYRRFLTLTAKAAKVEIDALSPKHFDEKSRQSESLLISAIFLDLIKMLDQISTASARAERAGYHKLFIRFTLGQPFQAFAAENLRKYIDASKHIKNRKEFIATYNRIQNKKFCLIATWAFDGEDKPEVQALRMFRDQVLSDYFLGRCFIGFYYGSAPLAHAILRRVPFAKVIFQRALGDLVRKLPVNE